MTFSTAKPSITPPVTPTAIDKQQVVAKQARGDGADEDAPGRPDRRGNGIDGHEAPMRIAQGACSQVDGDAAHGDESCRDDVQRSPVLKRMLRPVERREHLGPAEHLDRAHVDARADEVGGLIATPRARRGHDEEEEQVRVARRIARPRPSR